MTFGGLIAIFYSDMGFIELQLKIKREMLFIGLQEVLLCI